MTAANDLVLVRIEERRDAGRVAYVTANNPAKRNAVGIPGKRAIVEARRTDEPKRLMEAFLNRRKK
jgi:hypothetical protein